MTTPRKPKKLPRIIPGSGGKSDLVKKVAKELGWQVDEIKHTPEELRRMMELSYLIAGRPMDEYFKRQLEPTTKFEPKTEAARKDKAFMRFMMRVMEWPRK